MNKRGPTITIIGVFLVGISLLIAMSIVPSNVDSPNDLSVYSLFEVMFDEISDEIQIVPGSSAYFSYGADSDASILWGIQIIDYESGDELSIQISNIFGDDYGEFNQDESILFEILHIPQSDMLNFEIQNTGPRTILIVMMFSEDPENSDVLSNPDSPVMNMVLPLIISGFLLILGSIISIVGVTIILVDWKNNQNNKQNY
ncbi:MAG: hypothetical protein ACRBB5_08515 [Nitrosopumilus sp.]